MIFIIYANLVIALAQKSVLFCYVSQKECAEEALAPAKMKDAAATKKAVEKKEKVAAAERKVQEEAAKIANENAAATIKKAK